LLQIAAHKKEARANQQHPSAAAPSQGMNGWWTGNTFQLSSIYPSQFTVVSSELAPLLWLSTMIPGYTPNRVWCSF
jgi:hypothetical protein